MNPVHQWHTPGENFGFFLHDAHVAKIEITEEYIEFVFDADFKVIDNDEIIEPKEGRIRLSGCDPSDFFVYLVKSRASKKGLKFRGRGIELDELCRLVDCGHKIEIFEEHDERKRDGSIFEIIWIGAILPHKKGRRWDTLYLKVDGISSVEFAWE